MSARTRRLKSAALLWTVVVLSGARGVVAQVNEPKVRTTPEVGGTTIEKLLLPGDDVVVIVKGEEGTVLVGQPNQAQMVNYLHERSDVAVVAEVVAMSGTMIASSTWINTNVVAKTYDVLMNKSSLEGVAPTRRLEFQTTGGEVMIGNVLVKAGHAPAMQIGRRYLLFLQRNAELGVFFPMHPPLLVEHGRVTSATDEWQRGMRDPLVGQTISKIAAQLNSK